MLFEGLLLNSAVAFYLQDLSVILWVFCFSSTHGYPQKKGPSVCMPACSLCSLLHSAGLSGLLTAAIHVSFYTLMTGLLKSDGS